MPRYAPLEYDGGAFAAGRRQANAPSVQAALERPCSPSRESVWQDRAGRTDAGVHATGQAAHVDLARDWPRRTVQEALTPPPPAASPCSRERSARSFNARFYARARRYLYRILNRAAPPALLRGQVWPLRRPLDADAMHDAAQALVGLHDFTTFRRALPGEVAGQDADEARVERVGEEVGSTSRALVPARQVRSMTGRSAQVGMALDRATSPDALAAATGAVRTGRAGAGCT
jgi:tRNA pseudouridine38-40 synthase